MSTIDYLPINDLKRHNAAIEPELRQAIDRVLARGWYILGPEVEAFEQEFAAYVGAGHCIGVGNGTDALEIAIRALNPDRVATVANAGGYSKTAILACGATPVYVDIEPETMNMDPRIVPKADALILTHLYGRIAQAPSVDIPIIEDCAQAHGSAEAGNRGVLACWSFYPTKNLGALGDGGAITTNDADLARRIRALRQYGWTSKYKVEYTSGRNSRLDELQAAILRAKLPHLDRWVLRRRQIAARYNDAFELPDIAGHAAHLYVIRHPERDLLRKRLKLAGIGTDVHYPNADSGLPNSDLCCREVLTLPCFPEMTDAELHRVINETRAALKES